MRHTLSHQRGEWQQRIQAVLYHHGCPQRGELLTLAGREWLAMQPLCPAGARAADHRAARSSTRSTSGSFRLIRELRAFARAQAGCRALIDELYGVGELAEVTILAELGDARRFPTPATLSASPAWISPSTNPTIDVPPGTSPAKGRPRCAGRCLKRRCAPRANAARTIDYYSQAAERIGSNRARLSVARKILKRSYHLLREFSGDEAIAPI